MILPDRHVCALAIKRVLAGCQKGEPGEPEQGARKHDRAFAAASNPCGRPVHFGDGVLNF
jgi:hypothetical protein